MVTRKVHPARGQSGRRGALSADLVVAMGILAAVALPMTYAFEQEMKLCRSHYDNAVAMELVDGEMEILAAGEWRAFQPGTQPYTVRADAAKNLPPGKFLLTLRDRTIRLEWQPARKGQGQPIVREARGM